MGIIITQAEATDSFPPWIKPSPLILPQLMNSITQPPANSRGRGSCDPGLRKEKENRRLKTRAHTTRIGSKESGGSVKQRSGPQHGGKSSPRLRQPTLRPIPEECFGMKGGRGGAGHKMGIINTQAEATDSFPPWT